MTEQKAQAEQKTQTNSQMPKESEGLTREELKGVVEALLFASQRPLSANDLKDIIEVEDTKPISALIDEIKKEYLEGNRSFKLVEIAGGFQFTTDPVYAKWLRKLYKVSRGDHLTKPGLETLSIIAYKQPITKAEIEFIRGVNIDGVIKTLLQKGLVRISGKKKVIGAPYLYSTTRFFLQYFGLNSLDDLPKLPEFSEADIKIGDEMLVENSPRPSFEEEQGKEGRGEQTGGIEDETENPTPEN